MILELSGSHLPESLKGMEYTPFPGKILKYRWKSCEAILGQQSNFYSNNLLLKMLGMVYGLDLSATGA